MCAVGCVPRVPPHSGPDHVVLGRRVRKRCSILRLQQPQFLAVPLFQGASLRVYRRAEEDVVCSQRLVRPGPWEPRQQLTLSFGIGAPAASASADIVFGALAAAPRTPPQHQQHGAAGTTMEACRLGSSFAWGRVGKHGTGPARCGGPKHRRTAAAVAARPRLPFKVKVVERLSRWLIGVVDRSCNSLDVLSTVQRLERTTPERANGVVAMNERSRRPRTCS